MIALQDWQFPVEEYSVLRVLREKSREFQTFEEQEGEKVSPILWVRDISLEVGVNARAYSKGYICIRRSPAHIEDAFIIAHEMMHLIRANEGNPLKIRVYDRGHITLATKLMSMFEDPIVDSILQDKYGFKIVDQYKLDLKSAKEQIKGFPEPDDYILRVKSAVDFTGQALEWGLIKEDRDLVGWRDFRQRWLPRKRPITSKMSDEMIAIVQEVGGLDTLKKQKTIFEKIVEEYELQNVLYLE
jgi:hypothetical protein